MILKRSFISIAVLTTLAACSTLPSHGPSTSEIITAQKASVKTSYRVIDINSNVIALLNTRKNETLSGSFPDRRGGISDAIGLGDIVQVTIWEAAAGGLFSAASTQLSGQKSASIPEQPVSTRGTITVPYVGIVKAAGRTPDELKIAIEQALAGKAIEPQVLVSVTKNVANTVTITGEGVRGGLTPLTARGDKILDSIAFAGGAPASTHEIFVILSRGSRSVKVPLQAIIDDPRENILLRPGDTVVLVREPQTFTVFGAASSTDQLTFNAKGIFLDEAVARVGGLKSTQADPAGVFIFRFEDPKIVALIDPQNPALREGRSSIPIVYRMNLREASGLFLAKSFRIFDKDLIYVSDSALTELQKFVALINTLIDPAQRARNLVDNL